MKLVDSREFVRFGFLFALLLLDDGPPRLFLKEERGSASQPHPWLWGGYVTYKWGFAACNTVK